MFATKLEVEKQDWVSLISIIDNGHEANFQRPM